MLQKALNEAPGQKAIIATAATALSEIVQGVCEYSLGSRAVCETVAGVPMLLKVLLAMMALDLLTGVLAANLAGERIRSDRFGKGVIKKILMLVVVTGAALIGNLMTANSLPGGEMLFLWTTGWFIATEFISLYENAEKAKLPMPTFLKRAAEKVLNKVEIVIPPDDPPPPPKEHVPEAPANRKIDHQ